LIAPFAPPSISRFLLNEEGTNIMTVVRVLDRAAHCVAAHIFDNATALVGVTRVSIKIRLANDWSSL